MISLGKYMRAARGGPNMASRIPASEGTGRAMDAILRGAHQGQGFVGSSAGLDSLSSAWVQPIGTGYNKAIQPKGRFVHVSIKRPMHGSMVRPPIDYRRIDYNGLRMDDKLSNLL